MKKLIYFFLLIAIVSCSEEDALTPSMAEVDFVKIKDDPSDPLQHQRYQIYERYNVSLYFNDTLGVETKMDSNGESYLHYFILKPHYAPNGNSENNLRYVLYEKEELPQMVEFTKDLGNNFLDKMPKVMNIHNVLIVDSIFVGFYPVKKEYFLGFNTIVVSDVVEKYNENFWEDLRIKICSDKALAEYAWQRDNFFPISNALNVASTSSLKSYTKGLNNQSDIDFYLNYPGYGWPYLFQYMLITPERINGSQTLADVGFLERLSFDPNLNDPSVLEKDWITPNEKEDLNSYVQLLFTKTPVEVAEIYKNYPVVLKKYNLLKERFESFGITFE